MFAHFGPNTFTDKEWGDGTENPDVFAPSDLDCEQWVLTAKQAGMRGIIITAKHHDGFCLWPSRFSTHTVRESAWRDGQGDVLEELSEACKRHGMRFGVYLSPWDRNHPDYGTPLYNTVFASTLEEIHSSYGDIFEQWFDGAGDDPKNRLMRYDWTLFNSTVLNINPQAIIFSDVGPGCRWMGNENGIAGATNWSLLNTEGFSPGRNSPPLDTLNQGNANGKNWIPAEVDVSIRPGWFFSDETTPQIKTAEELMQIYYTSVGRNANLLLNVPPDRTGRINAADSTRLMEFKAMRESLFSDNKAGRAEITASDTRGRKYATKNLTDNDFDTYWCTDEDVKKATLQVSWDEPVDISHVVLQEYIPLGQRVKGFKIESVDADGSTSEIASGTTIGYKRILRTDKVSVRKIKITIEAKAPIVMNNLEIY